MLTIEPNETMQISGRELDLRRLLAGLMVGLGITAALLAGCGSVEIGIEHVPQANASTLNTAIQSGSAQNASEQISATPTVEAAQTEINQAAEESSPEPAPTFASSTATPGAVAYVQGGDIWFTQVSGDDGQRRVITEQVDGNVVSMSESVGSSPLRVTYDGRNHSPHWSPSGEWLSYLKGDDLPELWIVRRDGGGARLVATGVGEAYAWSPVVDALAYAEGGGISLVIPQLPEPVVWVGPDAIETPVDANASIGKIAWSPDGEKVAFTWSAQSPDEGEIQDGLWVVDRAEGTPVQVLEGNLPEQGQILLHGWSGDGQHLIYWQAAILSASILADGVPLYSVPVEGGTPQLLAEPILVHEDAVESQPNGLPQVTVVVGSGRQMWHEKRLQTVVVGGTQKWELTPFDQAVTSPVWSPDGSTIAYIGMPDVEGVDGGPEAKAALNQRQLWIVEGGNIPEPRPVTGDMKYREEAPYWIDNEILLIARLDPIGRASLWLVSKTGEEQQLLVPELTPVPEWFGFYGYIDWSRLFAVWRPVQTETPTVVAAMTPTLVPLTPATGGAKMLDEFLNGLYDKFEALTSEEALMLWGEPDVVTGSGLVIYQYKLADGVTLWLGFPGSGPLAYAQLESSTGQRFALTPMKSEGAGEHAITPTATPAAMHEATTLPPTVVPRDDRGDTINTTPTPASIFTATPLPTVAPPDAEPTLVPTGTLLPSQ
jgi:Tol biopolymer transport system component